MHTSSREMINYCGLKDIQTEKGIVLYGHMCTAQAAKSTLDWIAAFILAVPRLILVHLFLTPAACFACLNFTQLKLSGYLRICAFSRLISCNIIHVLQNKAQLQSVTCCLLL